MTTTTSMATAIASERALTALAAAPAEKGALLRLEKGRLSALEAAETAEKRARSRGGKGACSGAAR